MPALCRGNRRARQRQTRHFFPRFDNESTNAENSSLFTFPVFGDDSHFPVMVYIAEADVHLVRDVLDGLEEPLSQRLF